MTVPAPLAFPGGRTLAGWWRQLSPWQPRSLWVGHLFLHRVEALVLSTRPLHPDPLHGLILKAIALHPEETLEALDQHLHLGQQVLDRVMHSLSGAGLLTTEGDRPVATKSGLELLAQGAYQATVHERRPFYFVEPGPPGAVPHFLPLEGPPTVSMPAADGWRFEGQWLAECVAQSAEWKRRFGFPTEIKEVTFNRAVASTEWRQVILDRPERLPVAMILSRRPEGGDRLLAFAVRQENWTLQAEAPSFALDDAWQTIFPFLGEGPSAVEWEDSWRSWCQPRGLPADTGGFQLDDHRLRVTVPPRLLERLRSSRSDALKGDAWLLAGTGRLRAAAQIEIVESEPRPALRQA